MPTGAQNFQKGKITKLNCSIEPVCDPSSRPKTPRPNVHLYRQNHGVGYAGNAATLSLNIMRHWQSHSESPPLPLQKRQYELAVHLRLLKITLDASQIQRKGIKEVQQTNLTIRPRRCCSLVRCFLYLHQSCDPHLLATSHVSRSLRKGKH